ncbi:hypothetical protein GCM10025876_12980 [Demequina litorisediminis]|uniref:Uncharacterized protein n=1 Tax=Demequina litorisediminis TaxID=1849022 RepID=A0ABQ6IBA9_9MICO|nr:hypothetical protein GCM10025876_12980 [Demequina litorisediminis]
MPRLVEARNGVAVWRDAGFVEHRHEAALDAVTHDVLPPARFFVHVRKIKPDDVHQEPLGETVLAHHPHRGAFAEAR